MLCLALLALLPFPAGASSACGPHPLRLVAGPAMEGEMATAEFRLEQGVLLTRIEVSSPERNVKPELGAGEYPFHFDVAEAFVSVDGGAPYYEFEATPLGQTLTVKVLDPSKPFETGLSLGLEVSTETSDSSWAAELKIPLARLGWTEEKKITGNAFVILGKAPGRRYYALNLPPQPKARFHQPEHFVPLGCPGTTRN